MSKIAALREERTTLAKETRKLVEDRPENSVWTPEDQTAYDQKVARIDQIDAQIERHQKVLDLEAANKHRIQETADREGISEDEAEYNAALAKQALNSWLRGGVGNLTDKERAFWAQRMRSAQNTMSTTTGSEGGYVTQREFAPQLVEAMAAFGGMRSVATIIQTDTGSPMDFPTADATSEEGEIVGENESVDDEDTTFGTKALSVYKYSSKAIAVPMELLQDSQIDLEQYIRGLLATRLGRITNKHFTIGTGGGAQPNGLIPSAVVGKTGLSATGVTYDDLVDLEHSVDPAYRVSPKCGFMFHDTTLRELKKLKDDNERPLWLPGLVSGEPDLILNRPYTINQHMAPMAANAKSLAFGDFSKYIIRDVMQLQLFRFTDSAYTKKGQVGFLAFLRSGGNLIDVGGAVKVFQNAAGGGG
jgi:HK97 family phage major capsid protein